MIKTVIKSKGKLERKMNTVVDLPISNNELGYLKELLNSEIFSLEGIVSITPKQNIKKELKTAERIIQKIQKIAS